MLSLLLKDNIYDIYQFIPCGALFSWPTWQQMCRSGQINARKVLADHLEHMLVPQEVPDSYCILMAWLIGNDMERSNCYKMWGLVCAHLNDVLTRVSVLAAIEIINLTLLMMAATNAPYAMQMMVRRKISAYLFEYDSDLAQVRIQKIIRHLSQYEDVTNTPDNEKNIYGHIVL